MNSDTARVLLRKKLTASASEEDAKALILDVDDILLAITSGGVR